MNKRKSHSLRKLLGAKSYILITDKEAIMDVNIDKPTDLNDYVTVANFASSLALMHDNISQAEKEYMTMVGEKFGIPDPTKKTRKRKPTTKTTKKAPTSRKAK